MDGLIRRATIKMDSLINNAVSKNKFTKPLYRKFVAGEVEVGPYQIRIPPIRVGILNQKIDNFIIENTKNKIFWDIGSNIGYYSILASTNAKFIRSFEPEPNNFNILTENIDRNDINNIEAMEVAVSDENGRAKLYREPIQGGGIHSLAEDERLTEEPCTVELKTIDSLTREYEVPDIIKVDVEGAEQKVLEGSIKTLQNDSVEWFIEVHSPKTSPETKNNTNRLDQHGGDINTLHKLLTENGYHVFGLQNDKIVEFDLKKGEIPLYWYAKKECE